MSTKSIRTVLAAAVAGVAATAAAVTLFDTGAGAAAKSSPITGGTTTLSMSTTQLGMLEASGLDIWQTASPASSSVDPSSGDIDYSFPVTSGDASVNTFFGTESLAGDLILHDHNTNKSLDLRELRFDIAADAVSAVGATPRTPRTVIFDALGTHQYSGKPSAPPETFSASDLQIDAAGATFINTALGENVVSAGESVGAFYTSFTNTVN